MRHNEAQVLALIGGQYGSEGKGVIAAQLADRFGMHIRTGGPNAGHTFMAHGEKFVARGLPVGWINPEATLLIGPGAVVDIDLLDEEIKEAELRQGFKSVRPRVVLDEKAHVITAPQHRFEGGVDGAGHEHIGSTGEGVGMARVARILRDSWLQGEHWAKACPVSRMSASRLHGIPVGDTVAIANGHLDAGGRILLEGTQGSGLSLTHGWWPYVTSADTNAAQLASDAGIAPQLVETLMVFRTFPIRVHGNSGPLHGEIDFATLGVEPEVTTVTKKERRIGQWDWDLALRSVMLNRPCAIALTFLDYWDPDTRGVQVWEGLSSTVHRHIREIEQVLRTPVVFATTGPAGTPVIEISSQAVTA